MTVPRFAASPARAIAALTPAVSPHPGRLELIYGLRAAIVTVLPLILAELTGKQWLAGLALGGWLGSMADPGGAYEARARWMIAFILGGALCTAIGTLIVGPPWVLAGAMFACAATLAMLRVYGDSGATLATLLTVLVAAAFSATSHTVDAAVRAGSLVAAGGALAALLALVVWPVRRDAPAREALGDSFAQLAAFVREIASTLSTTERGDASDATVRANVDARWHALANRWPGDLRRVIERTRDVIGEARARRLGRSESADVLGELVGAADRMFATLVAISEELASLDGRARDERACAASIVVLERLTDALEHLATALAPPSVTTTMRAPKIAPNDAQVLDEAVVGLWSVVDDEPGDGERAGRDSLVVAHLARAAALLEEAATDVQSAMETITFADSDRRGARDAARDATAIDEHVSNSRMSVADRVWLPLRANLTWESLMFRHAIRLGVATSVSMYAATHIGAGRGIWITTTVVLLLQPYAGVTLARGVFRILGTVGGGVVAALLSVALHRPLAVAAAMFPLTVIAAAARRSHYALFTFFLTPVFVLMAEHSMGDWRLAVTRIVSTLAGAAIALLASRLLWPTWEHERMPGQFAELLDAARTYFRGVAAPQLREAPRVPANEGRRRLGLATNNAESAMQRFVGEPRGQWSDVEALATFLTHVRRLNGSLVALGAAPQGADASGDDAARTARAIDSALQDIAGAVHDGREPAPLPAAIAPSSQTGEHPVVHHVVHHVRAEAAHAAAQAPLARVARAVRRLHRSATRLAQ